MTNTTNPADAVEVTPTAEAMALARMVHSLTAECGLVYAGNAIDEWLNENYRLASSTPEPVATTQAPDAVERAALVKRAEGLLEAHNRAMAQADGADHKLIIIGNNGDLALQLLPHFIAALSTLPTADAGPVAETMPADEWGLYGRGFDSHTGGFSSMIGKHRSGKEERVFTKWEVLEALSRATPSAPNADLVGLVKRLRDAGVKLHIAGCPKAARDVAKAADALEALSREGAKNE